MKTGIMLMVVCSLAACGGSDPQRPQSVAKPPLVTQQTPDAAGFASALNRFRAAQGLGPLRQNAALTRAAVAHAADMERRGYFSHASEGGPNGADFVSRAAAAGCRIQAGAENIAQGQRSETDVLFAWQNSSGHRANLLDPAYRVYGLGRSGDTWVLKLSAAC